MAATVPVKVEGVQIVGRTGDSVTLEWTVVEGATKYGVECSPYSRWSAYSWTKHDAGSVTQFTVRNLTIATPYAFRVQAANDDNAWGPTSEATEVVTTLTLEEDRTRLLKECASLQAELGRATGGSAADGAGAGAGAAVLDREQLRTLQNKYNELLERYGRHQKERSAALQHVTELETQARTAKAEADRLREQLAGSTADAAAARVASLETELAGVKAAQETAEAHGMEVEAELDAVKEQLREAEARVEAAEKAGFEAGAKAKAGEITALQELVETLKAGNTEKTSTLAALENQLAACQADLRAAKEGAGEATAAMDAARTELDAVRDEAQVAKAQLAEAQAQLKATTEAAAANNGANADLVAKLKAEAEASHKARTEAAAADARAEEAVAKAKAEVEAAQKRIAESEAKVQHYNQLVSESGANMEELREQVLELTEGKATLQGDIARLSRDKLEFDAKIAEAEAQVKAATEAKEVAEAAAASTGAASSERTAALEAQVTELTARATAATTRGEEREAELVAALSEAQSERVRLVDANEELKAEVTAKDAKIASLTRHLAARDELSARCEELQNKLAVAQQALLSARAENVTHTAAVQEAVDARRAEAAARASAETRVATLQATVDTLTRKVTEAAGGASAAELREMREQIASYMQRVQHLEELNSRLEDCNADLNKKVEDLLVAVRTAQGRQDEALAAAAAVEAERDAAVADLNKAREELSALKTAEATRRPPAEMRKESVEFFRSLGWSNAKLQNAVDNLSYLVDDMGFDEAESRMAIMNHPGNREAQANYMTSAARK